MSNNDVADAMLSGLSTAINAFTDLEDLAPADERMCAEWEARLDALMGEILAWQRSHSPEAEEAASDMDWERRIDEAREEWR